MANVQTDTFALQIRQRPTGATFDANTPWFDMKLGSLDACRKFAKNYSTKSWEVRIALVIEVA